MHSDILTYEKALEKEDRAICESLRAEISAALPNSTSKLWHGHPVWFLDGNPIVGYSKQKAGLRLMFWSGADFDESSLKPGSGKFKDASIFYQTPEEVNVDDLKRWLEKAKHIQWDYKNIVKNKGILNKLV